MNSWAERERAGPDRARRSGPDAAAGDLRPLATDPTAFAFGQTSPDAELLTVLQCELEAVVPHLAAATDLLGLTGGCTSLWEEQVGVDAQAVRVIVPIGVGFDRSGADGDAGRGDELHVKDLLQARNSCRLAITR